MASTAETLSAAICGAVTVAKNQSHRWRSGGGMPPFPTCKLAGLAPSFRVLRSAGVLHSTSRVLSSTVGLVAVAVFAASISAQEPKSADQMINAPKKINTRPAEVVVTAPDPFDGASVEKMAQQCVTLETEVGAIEIEMIPEVAPESVRNFLNLTATHALDTTTFSRVVKDFIIQGGNLSTSEAWGLDLAKKMAHKLPDEPGLIKHVRGIVSMARPEEANSASTHFFILVGNGPHLDGKFSAFGRVTKGIEVADAINHAPAEGEKPAKPVRIKRGLVAPCSK